MTETPDFGTKEGHQGEGKGIYNIELGRDKE